MFKEILYENQLNLIGILKTFSRSFYLAGGTAIALQLGHRKSLDFDLFSSKKIENTKILMKLKESGYSVDRILVDNKGEELTIISGGVKITFLYYPFQVERKLSFEGISLPDILTLGAMKFYTLGRRGKWKDYVDIYHILSSGYTLKEISQIAERIFQGGYNEKLLREQLCYFEDIDYTEEIEYRGKGTTNGEVEKYLCDKAINEG
ncbi:MAG: nucleotidyl transferase AbiEii/AbiGii toxin family protein [Candidatus Gracilibacteria bacterium]|nr:nucleotidyl transferase AbiEii/AbiGii toxin family protein [Candidatus Gracilibacteria bacterium]